MPWCEVWYNTRSAKEQGLLKKIVLNYRVNYYKTGGGWSTEIYFRETNY